MQADRIIPNPGNSQAWDRYAYTLNNPVKYIDPSGHLSCDAKHVAEGDCSDVTIRDLISEYNVTLVGDWKPTEVGYILQALQATGTKLASSMGDNQTSSEAFKSVYNTMEFNMWDGQCAESCWGWSLGANLIRFYRTYTLTDGLDNSYILNTKISEQLVVHELGHSFESATNPTGGKPPRNYLSTDMTEDRNGLAGPLWTWQQSEDITSGEIFADMFLGWVYDIWYQGPYNNLRVAAVARQNFMNQFMPTWLQNNIP